MKTILLCSAALLLWMDTEAHAAVVDRFQCQMKFAPPADSARELVPRGLDTTVELSAARRAIEGSYAPNITVTEGTTSASVSSAADRMQIAFRLVSLHAIKRSPAGQALQAAQHVCLSHTFLVGGHGVSMDCRPECNNPFDRRCKWAPVELRGGVPVFAAGLMKSVSHTLVQGTLDLSCRFEGTIE